MALTQDSIIAASLGILDEFGLADLTMRRVASELDVKAGALYWHFPNKQTLLAAVADQVLAGLEEPDGRSDIAEWLTSWADRFRQLLLAHRDAAELVASALALRLGAVDPCESGRLRLEELGLGGDEADATMQAHLHFVLGHTVEEQTRSQLVALGVLEHADTDRSERHFATGVALLVNGVSQVLSATDGISIRSMA